MRDRIWIEINVAERPRLGNFKFEGAKKSEVEELQGKIGLTKQVIITENMRRNIIEVTEKYYREKGFQNVKVTISEKNDPTFVNSNFITINVDKGGKVRIENVNIFGNENVDELKIKKQLKGTKETSRFTLFSGTDTSVYGEKKIVSFHEYAKDWGFLSFSKTRRFSTLTSDLNYSVQLSSTRLSTKKTKKK